MGKITYVIFLAIASSKEIAQIFSLHPKIYVELPYLVFFIYLIIKMFSNSLSPWIWRGAFGIVGLSALMYLILVSLGLPDHPLKVIDSSICLWMWIKSLIYLNNYNEDIREI
jgi:hypothetical protein